jgi:hypothetical protein
MTTRDPPMTQRPRQNKEKAGGIQAKETSAEKTDHPDYNLLDALCTKCANNSPS